MANKKAKVKVKVSNEPKSADYEDYGEYLKVKKQLASKKE